MFTEAKRLAVVDHLVARSVFAYRARFALLYVLSNEAKAQWATTLVAIAVNADVVGRFTHLADVSLEALVGIQERHGRRSEETAQHGLLILLLPLPSPELSLVSIGLK